MVYHLATFINSKQHCHGGLYKVDIRTEVERFREKNPGVRPKIVFDFSACFTLLMDKSGEDIRNGGRQLMCSHYARNLCEKLKALDVDLIFILEGPVKKSKLAKYIDDSNRRYERQTQFFLNITDGKIPNIYTKNRKLSIYLHNFFKTIREYSKISISFENECDVDVAYFATRVNAVAVVSIDTDFLIFPGDWQIWLANKLDIDNYKAWCWSKKNLRIHLHLSQRHMPIFATLSGNDFVPYKYVKHLHDDNDYPRPKQKILAEYVNAEYHVCEPLFVEKFQQLVDIIYNGGENDIKLYEAHRMVKTSLDFYNFEMRREPLVEIWLKHYIQATNSVPLYLILKNHRITVHQSWIDMSDPDVIPYSKMVIPILRRQFGIVLDHQRDNCPERQICFKPSHEEPYQTRIFTPIYYDVENKSIPDLTDLFQSPHRNDDGLYDWNNFEHIVPLEEKFNLLGWLLSPTENDLDHTKLLKFAECPLFVAILSVNYLVKMAQITVEEADILLLSLNEALNMDISELICIEPPENVYAKCFRLMHLYNRFFAVCNDALNICGLYPYTRISHFDGIIFGKLWQKFLTLDDADKQALLEPIGEYRIYL